MSTPNPPRASETRYPDIPVGPRLESVLALAYRARCAVLLEGSTGIGKSELVQQVAAKLGIGTAVLDLSLLEPPDLVGLPVISDGRTEYALPRVLPRDGAGILMLEELNRAERYIQQPALQLLTARRLHEYVLPEAWVCFAAINPESGDYQVAPLDRALRARFMNLGVRADRASWLSWAHANGVHPAIVALAQSHERVFDDVPPRTWTYASQVLAALTPAEIADDTLVRDALGGYLPPAWCETLLASRDRWSSSLGLDVRDALANYSANSAAARTLEDWRKRGLTDRFDELTHRAMGIVQGPELGALLAQGKFSLSAFEALLGDLPGDQRDKLQEAFAKNPAASPALDVTPADLLGNYPGSAAEKKVRAWASDPLRQHRLGAMVNTLRMYLSQYPGVADLRRNNTARISLGVLLSQLSERWAMPLVETLLKLGITPIKPR